MLNKSSLKRQVKVKAELNGLEECSGKEKVDGIGRETEQKTVISLEAKWISCVKKKQKQTDLRSHRDLEPWRSHF